ncbi:transmembrane protein 87A isoform X1 [Lissotriton helveticus]
MAARSSLCWLPAVLLLQLLLLPPCPTGAAEVSKWNVTVLTESKFFNFGRILFKNSTVYIKFEGDAKTCDPSWSYNVTWYLRYADCYSEVFSCEEEKCLHYFESTSEKQPGRSGSYAMASLFFPDCTDLLKPQEYYKEFVHPAALTSEKQQGLKDAENATHISVLPDQSEKPTMNAVMKTWHDGPYIFIVKVSPVASKTVNSTAMQEAVTPASLLDNNVISMIVEVKGPYEYLPLSDYPLMIFFMVMCIVYTLFGFVWLVWSVCYWRNLLRIQFWIGAVIFLGMLEKAVFYAEFHNIRYKGESVQGAAVLAELLSALKRSLARILVIIVSLGYGIVKPRLGATLHKVVMAGAFYLLFSGLEGVLRVTGLFFGMVALVANLGLSVIDACILLWIFISLTQTMKQLRLRRNVVKLSLYRHFTNTLILAVAASVAFIIWTTVKFRLSDCPTDWQELWVDDAIWRLLFSMILFVIMVLWRPSANNQRFAFSPLNEEEEDDEQKEPMLNDSFVGMKMRNSKQETNGNVKPNKTDDDLKWVDENVPSSVTDVALPALLDSDEERLITHFERSKME